MRREKHGIINPWPVKEAVARMAKQFSDWTQQVLLPFLFLGNRPLAFCHDAYRMLMNFW